MFSRSGIWKFLAQSRLVVLLAVAGIAQAQAPAADVQGTWVVIQAERQLVPYPDLVGATVTFSGNKFRIERPGRSVWQGTLRVDAGAGKIDMAHEGSAMVPPVRGDKWEGIYRFTGDTLEINTSQGHDARPSEFLSGYDLILMKLQRR